MRDAGQDAIYTQVKASCGSWQQSWRSFRQVFLLSSTSFRHVCVNSSTYRKRVADKLEQSTTKSTTCRRIVCDTSETCRRHVSDVSKTCQEEKTVTKKSPKNSENACREEVARRFYQKS